MNESRSPDAGDGGATIRPNQRLDPDFDLRVPDGLLVIAPVAIALLTLLISLAGPSVYFGFDENEPGTWLSTTLMLCALLLALPAVTNKAFTPGRRRAGTLFSVAIFAALLDENMQWHEAVGTWVQGLGSEASYPVLVYTDDVLILLLAVAATWFLWKLVRSIPDWRDYLPLVVLVGSIALLHGVLDILGHRHYIWQIFFPDMTHDGSYPLRFTLGFYEETAKLWTEYFVILFLLRFFYSQTVPISWTLLVAVGSWMATGGLWAVENPLFAPYIVMGWSLRFVRNYMPFLAMSTVWIAWTLYAWRRFRGDAAALPAAGLFFLWPLVQAPAWALFAAASGLGFALHAGWRPKRRIRRFIVAGCLSLFLLGLALSNRAYLTQRPFYPPESVLFDRGEQLLLRADR